MKTPTKNAPDGHSPISYDIESSGKGRYSAKFLNEMANDTETGASDIQWSIVMIKYAKSNDKLKELIWFVITIGTI